LRGSGQTIATVVAHREPWGVKKPSTTTILKIIQKVKKKKLIKIRFLDFVFEKPLTNIYMPLALTLSPLCGARG
jgi:hypothetical protein